MPHSLCDNRGVRQGAEGGTQDKVRTGSAHRALQRDGQRRRPADERLAVPAGARPRRARQSGGGVSVALSVAEAQCALLAWRV